MPKYVVKVLRTVRYQVELVVSADNEDDVCDKAEKLCRDGLTGLPDAIHGSVRVEAEAIDVQPYKPGL